MTPMLAPFFLALGLLSQNADPATLGPKVGEPAPDFTAIDQDGRERPLASLMGPRGLMLVFFRSADW
jgi:hypothetical protein